MFDTGLFDAIVGFVDPGFYLRASGYCGDMGGGRAAERGAFRLTA